MLIKLTNFFKHFKSIKFFLKYNFFNACKKKVKCIVLKLVTRFTENK